MSARAREELEKLQAMRAELEAESRSLKEQQSDLENNVISLEEKVANEELKKEQALIQELKSRNKAAKDAIAELEAQKKKLENKLEEVSEITDAPPRKKEAKKEPSPPEETEEAVEAVEIVPEEIEEDIVTVTAIEGEALIESQELVSDSPSKQEKKKRRFF